MTYTVKEVAKKFSINQETVRRWIRNGKLSAAHGRKGDDFRISEEALMMFLEENPKYKAMTRSVEITGSHADALMASIEKRMSILRTVSDGLKSQQDYIQIEIARLEKDLQAIKSKLGAL
jgi:excisionase family DNA binding protein